NNPQNMKSGKNDLPDHPKKIIEGYPKPKFREITHVIFKELMTFQFAIENQNPNNCDHPHAKMNNINKSTHNHPKNHERYK
ncbi:MAG: hypothetical protein WD008_04305, partial [Balneolaceae bacterium]